MRKQLLDYINEFGFFNIAKDIAKDPSQVVSITIPLNDPIRLKISIFNDTEISEKININGIDYPIEKAFGRKINQI